MTNEAIGHEPLPLSARPSPTDVLGFLAFSHGWTWLFWAAAGAWGTSVWEPPATVFFVIGGAGVFVGGLVMSRLTSTRLALARGSLIRSACSRWSASCS